MKKNRKKAAEESCAVRSTRPASFSRSLSPFRVALSAFPLFGSLLCALAAGAEPKITYTDHILPLIEANCAKCHNADKKKGDLDLTSYSGLLRGGGSGSIVTSGNPDSSKLWKALTHAEEPTMPPNKPPLPDKDLALVRRWIAEGLLEHAGGKPLAPTKPAVDLTLKLTPGAKLDGPPPMPGELPLETVVHTPRGNPITGLAASPAAPLLAVAGQKQILLYHTQNSELLGILPFPDGQPYELKFSRSGKLLLAAGGHAAKSGQVLLWDVETGRRIAAVGHEYDAVLAADLSPDQTRVALGGPDRLIKIYATANGELLHKLKKHTDWVTAVAFSPNGEMLASADRNGGLTLWDPDNGQELVTTPGHKAAVTALSWRIDSRLVASSSEDGTVKLWDSSEGKQARTWNAHNGGVLNVDYGHDGRLVTSGRDGQVVTWSADGSKLKTWLFSSEAAPRCAFTHDAARVVATDFKGRAALWDPKTAQPLGDLDANPRPLTERIALARAALEELQNQGNNSSPRIVAAQNDLQQLTHQMKAAAQLAEQAQSDFATKAETVARLKELANGPNPPADLDGQLAAARALREKARTVRADTTAALEARTREVAEGNAKLERLRGATDPKVERDRAQAALLRLTAAQTLQATNTIPR